VYVDTSVFGGVFIDKFADASKRFFTLVRAGRFALVTSEVVKSEVARAPAVVQQLFQDITVSAELVRAPAEALRLAEAYLQAKVLPSGCWADAQHVAIATIMGCDLIVSWNFAHIVNYNRVPKYNAVNILRGYNAIAIYSPPEVITDEEEG
jgi:hypothetical protein